MDFSILRNEGTMVSLVMYWIFFRRMAAWQNPRFWYFSPFSNADAYFIIHANHKFFWWHNLNAKLRFKYRDQAERTQKIHIHRIYVQKHIHFLWFLHHHQWQTAVEPVIRSRWRWRWIRACISEKKQSKTN